MTTPREPSGPDRDRWEGEGHPPIERHPGFDRYPPPNAPRRRGPLPPLRPDAGNTLPAYDDRRQDAETQRHETPPGSEYPETRRLLRGRRDTEHGPTPRRVFPGRPKPSHHAEPDHTEPAGQLPSEPEPRETPTPPGNQRAPRKLTVTRVAAMRGRQLTEKGIATFQRAAKADGADESGLTALTYATMANFALDAAIAVALANTLFFASATAESKTKVALYLLITIAPFAVIAPLIGPMLDRLQRGRRLALATSFALRAVVAVVLIVEFDTWALYPLALCMMIGSKSFSVLKSAVTPRVLPPDIDLVRTNSRLTVFGLVGGTIGAGAVAALAASIAGSNGALVFAMLIAGAGTYLSLRIPSWVEVTEGEVPATLSYHGPDAHTQVLASAKESAVPPRKRRQPLGRSVVTGLWGNSAIRVLTGFLTFYVAFVAKATEHRPVQQAAMLGVVGAAAAVGNFTGNATGARLKLGKPSLIVLGCTAACALVALFATFANNLLGAALATLVAAGTSALAKVSLDAAIQDDLPPESIASGFGRSETVLQLSWVVGGAAGVLLPTDYWKGFAVVTAILVIGLVQTFVSFRGHSLLPGLGGNRPQHAEQEVPTARPAGHSTSTYREHGLSGPRRGGDTTRTQRGQGDPLW
ncbi:MFS transporter [Nocardia sp. NBC_00881]|uniref:MFS transporter n=1 Tax=Nocardia sp. NBC_00881 TaxID=2975995 RepID=UPI00386C3F4D|nr:MFS transporter [Nocardia sp. NBC_00881]